MIEGLRNWIAGVVGISILVAAAEYLMQEKGIRRIGNMVGGLLLAAAVLQPISRFEWAETVFAVEEDWSYQAKSAAILEENQHLLKTIIEEKTGAYISEQADVLGISCSARVVAEADQEGNFLPSFVEIRGHFPEGAQKKLREQIEEQLGIPAEHQIYREELE